MSVVLASEQHQWPTVQLADVAEIVRGVTYEKADAREEPVPGYMPVLRATNIQDARLVLDADLVHVPVRNISEGQRLRPGDIVVATSSGSKHLVGKSGQIHSEWKGSFGAFCAAIRPRPDIDSRYLALFLQSPDYWHQIGKKALGVNINNLRRGDIETLTLPLPARAIQSRIVAEIEKQFSRLDEAVANLKRVKANLKRYKASVLKAAVEGRLVPTEAELARREGRSYETAKQLLNGVVTDRRSRRAEKGKRSDAASAKTVNLQNSPAGWEWASVEEVGRLQLGRQRAPKYHAGPNMRPYLRVQNVFEDRIDLSDVMEMDFSGEDFQKYKLYPGDILLNEGQTPELLGRPALYRGELPDACFTNTLIRFQAYRCVLPEFALIVFLNHMHSGRFKAESNITTNIAHLSLGRLCTVEFPVPPLCEQERIVAEINRRLSIASEIVRQVGANQTRARALRQSVLSRSFRAP